MEDAEAKKPGWFYSQLMVITFSALSLEAIGNAFGERYIDRWEDFESSSLIAKLRLLCNHFNIPMEAENEPWSTAIWVVGFRNKIAHAKPQLVEESFIWTRDEYDKRQTEEPKSKLEKQITMGNARRALKAVSEIKDIFCDCIPIEDQHGLRNDGWTGSAKLTIDD